MAQDTFNGLWLSTFITKVIYLPETLMLTF